MSIPRDMESWVNLSVKKVAILTILLILFLYTLPIGCEMLEKSESAKTKEYVVSNVKDLSNAQAKNEQIANKEEESAKKREQTEKPSSTDDSESRTIEVCIGGETQEMPLEAYVAGVTAAEMPASFPEEALQAQAVAARTFAVSRMETETEDSLHPDAAVCDDYTHCAAYLDLDTQAQEQWGSEAEECRNKIEQAVRETSGEIVTYDGEPITAVFHAACGEETESALDVWGADVPYLVSVKSTGDAQCPDYTSSVTFGAEEFRQKMLTKYEKVNLTGLPATWFTEFQRADAGNVIKCTVGGVKAKGTTLRALLGLRSTNFTVSTTETSITFETKGYGHAVGMSQYGAKAMAEQGKSCEEILKHYYSGVEVEKLK